MKFKELDEDQRRRLIDASQVFEAWRAADQEFRHSYRGSMRWRKVKGKDYLYRIFGNVEHSMGARSPQAERVKEDYTEQRTPETLGPQLRHRSASMVRPSPLLASHGLGSLRAWPVALIYRPLHQACCGAGSPSR